MGALSEADAGVFAVVMATGIVGVGARLEGVGPLADVLLALACAAWVVLAGVVARNAFRRPPGRPRLQSFAVVAGTAVVGADFSLAGRDEVALALWSLALVLWLGVLLRRPRVSGLSGGSLLLVVGTESLGVLGAILALHHEAPLVAVALGAWALGLALYPLVAGAVVAGAVRGRRFDPDLWIVMGALAIATVAGGELLIALRGLRELAGLRAALPDLDLATWALASAAVPPLVVTELRVRRWRYEASRWSFVFPLAMYGVASHVIARADGLPALRSLGTVFLAVALAAWLVTAAGLGRLGRRDYSGRNSLR